MKKNKSTVVNYMKTAVPVCGAIALIIAAIGFIIWKIVSDYNYNERWKDYDECGL
ncbi:MAG: hypothetical protein IJF18_01310 [Oscillospiraceae bacterium]|nr:hypothetical protein [Oscillospiraceae bacterium]